MGGLSVETVTLGLGAVLLVTIFVTLVARHVVTRDGPVFEGDLTLYQLAMLAGGPSRVSDTALAYLTWSGMVEVRESTDRLVRVVGVRVVPDMHPVEAAVLSHIDPAGTHPHTAMASGRHAARQHVTGLDDLLVDSGIRRFMTSGTLVGCAAVVAGAWWWLTSRQVASTGFVPLIALIAVVYAGWWLWAGQPRVSGSGRHTLERIRARYDDDLQVAAIGVTSLPLQRAMHVIGLYGRDALTGGLSGLRKVMTGSPAPSLVVRSSLG